MYKWLLKENDSCDFDEAAQTIWNLDVFAVISVPMCGYPSQLYNLELSAARSPDVVEDTAQ